MDQCEIGQIFQQLIGIFNDLFLINIYNVIRI